MDVDADVDGALAQALGCLGTADRDSLIRDFRGFLGQPATSISDEAAVFFLDMNNWNLQLALGAFYDFWSSGEGGANPGQLLETMLRAPPEAVLVRDVTIGEGESVPKETRFRKVWRLRNPRTGPGSDWPPGCFLKHIEGPLLAVVSSVLVGPLVGGAEVDVAVEMRSPPEPGVYQSRWQLNTAQGVPFGESIWSIIVVDEGGLLGITQQMASTSCGPTAGVVPGNPFAMGPLASSSSTSLQHSATDDSADALPACDAPASPNGSSALHAAVSAAFPRQGDGRWGESAPLSIPGRGSPSVPPCTPSTPPSDLREHHMQS